MSRTVNELLHEALIHFEAATEYNQPDHPEPVMALDAMTMRLFAGLETLTRLPAQAVDAIRRELG